MNNGRTAAVFGATGLIGQAVIQKLSTTGWNIRIFARDTSRSRALFPHLVEQYQWNYDKDGWQEHVDGADAVFNFSGAPIFQKWKGNYKTEIVESRVKATARIAEAICSAKTKPAIFINGSAAGIYGYNTFNDDTVTEDYPAGKDFWGTFVTDWENAALKAEDCGTRVINIRTSVVLDRENGALPQLMNAFNRGIGGPIRPGNQWFPWIHIEDEVGMVLYALDLETVSGPMNASAPEVPRMRDFADSLGKAMGKPSRIPIPVTILRLMMGEVSKILANGRKVVPRKAEEIGYQFKFPRLNGALEDLLQK